MYPGCHVSALDFAISPGNLLTGKATILAPRFQTWDEAVPVSVDGSPVMPRVRGLPNQPNFTTGDGDLWFKVSSNDSTTVTGKFHMLDGGDYTDAPDVVFTINEWGDALDVNGQIGTLAAPVQLLFRNTVGYTPADEIVIPRDRAVWTQSLAVCAPTNEIDARVFVDGSAFRVRDIGLTMTRAIIKDPYVGGRWQDSFVEQGKRHYALTLKRRNLDKSLTHRIMYATEFGFRIDCYSGLIGDTGINRRLSFIGMKAQPQGKTPSVQNATTFEDDIVATFYPSDDMDYPTSVTCEAVNTQSLLQGD
jgi:hypothetical protein